jgi:F0F1-type ATP synthase assembly protein I
LPQQKLDKQRRRRRDRVKLISAVILGFAIGWLLANAI